MASYQLTVEERTDKGKSYARKLRAAGKIPAVVYGSGNPALSVEVDVREVEKALASRESLIELAVGQGAKTVIVKEIQRDPVRGSLQHLDFHEIDLSKKLEITVPIRIVGEDERASDGGVVTTLLWEVTVLCLPTDIPSSIEVDVSGLTIDDLISVDQLKLPEGVEVLEEGDEAVVKVGLPEREPVDEEEIDAEPETDAEIEPEAVAESTEDSES